MSKIILEEQVAPSTPGTNKVALYPKTGGGLYKKDDAGNEVELAPLDAPVFMGQVTIPIMNLTGGQIAFPATAVPSADPNTLDDYEEGYHTATVTCATSGGYTLDGSVNTLVYRKVGDLVHLQGYLSIVGENTPNGALRLSLPFVVANLMLAAEWGHTSFLLFAHGDAGLEKPYLSFEQGLSYVTLYNLTDTGTIEVIDELRVDTSFKIIVNFGYMAA